MRRNHDLVTCVLAVAALTTAGLTSACGGDDDPGGGPVETFSAHGISLTATTVRGAGVQTTTVTRDGAVQLTMAFRTDGVSLAFPEVAETTDVAFSTPLPALPTYYGSNLLATYVVAAQQTPATARQDSPGCDWFPDTQCTLGCCALHDRCYQENGCSASSWLPLVGSAACDNCNTIAAGCIAGACAAVIDAATDDRCYDNRCQQFYDCGAANCDCPSPCDDVSPSTCGNGSCEVMESVDNCPADCREGHGLNQCCVDNDGCPSETPETCPGACCCCGYGEVCSFATDLCAPSH